MCIAILKDEGTVLDEDVLRQCWDANSDGAGFMYSDGHNLQITKGLMTFESFMSAWKPHEKRKAAIHFRIRTHGATDEANTHPFQVGKSLGFIHNGMISINIKQKNMSDTHHFNEDILQKIYKTDSRFIFKEHYQELISNYIGYSKLVFLTNKGDHVIINEDNGEWNEGAWYSNTSYKKKKVIKPVFESRPALLTSSHQLKVGSKVTIRNHPTYSGDGFIAYFGQGATIGVQLDSQLLTVPIHSTFVFPLINNGLKVKVGDFVTREGNTYIWGEVLAITGDMATVEFEYPDTEVIYTSRINVKNLIVEVRA